MTAPRNGYWRELDAQEDDEDEDEDEEFVLQCQWDLDCLLQLECLGSVVPPKLRKADQSKWLQIGVVSVFSSLIL